MMIGMEQFREFMFDLESGITMPTFLSGKPEVCEAHCTEAVHTYEDDQDDEESLIDGHIIVEVLRSQLTDEGRSLDIIRELYEDDEIIEVPFNGEELTQCYATLNGEDGIPIEFCWLLDEQANVIAYKTERVPLFDYMQRLVVDAILQARKDFPVVREPHPSQHNALFFEARNN
jgi:hypothetical protein